MAVLQLECFYCKKIFERRYKAKFLEQINFCSRDIDFFVSTTLVYFQLDGVYWHGLDRPIVKQTNTTIQKTMLRDKKQIDWFQKNNKKLVRITDKQMLQYIKEQCASKIILDVGQGR